MAPHFCYHARHRRAAHNVRPLLRPVSLLRKAPTATMRPTLSSFIIVGVTTEGKTFRPSDWADRLCGVLSAFGSDNRMTYSPYVRPGCSLKGEKTVIVDARLHDIEPLAYNFLVHFARDNALRVDYVEPGESV